jgi:hypothetical protein
LELKRADLGGDINSDHELVQSIATSARGREVLKTETPLGREKASWRKIANVDVFFCVDI